MSDFLAAMGAGSRERVLAAKRSVSEVALVDRAGRAPVPPPLTLDRSGFDLIAEIKPRSPSAGQLLEEACDVPALARALRGAGACAL
ncbi:MAG TPA: hypothetical protein VJ826_08535, partial [Candidatus Polarisedimenticolaceae bacterium]|nr:hypothetical protein [Candidatus Polarisedimenticolaceae bacterium]